jgi:hypothetical protein
MKLDDILITLNCFGSHRGWYEKTIQAKKIVNHYWKKYSGSFEKLSASFISQPTLYFTLVSNLEDILYVRYVNTQLMGRNQEHFSKGNEKRAQITSLRLGIYVSGWFFILSR